MMIPITRKEKYINEIAGGGNTAPETPYTREELFFADILGEVVAPSPITRAEKYLAKIANRYSGELPEPVTRIERFLALAAGMDVTIPTPITREEMFWADYALIVEKELSGIPPLTFVSNGENLLDYRIYGSSGGVGDKTDNLWNEKATTDTDKYINASGGIATGAAGDRFLYLKVNVSPSTNYVFKWTENVLGTDDNTAYIRISEYTQSNRFIRRVLCNCSEQTQKAFSFTTDSNTSYIDVRTDSATSIKGQHLTGVMLITGTIPPETYEPYGYKIPIVCGGTTTNIYLDEPLRKTSKLPTGYTQVEYLESTGTQYIDTGVNLSNNSNVEINAKLVATQRSKTYYVFGSSVENNRYMIAVSGYTNNYIVDFGNMNNRLSSSVSAFDSEFHTHKITNLHYYIDGILQGYRSSLTFTNTSSAYIFDVRDRNTASTVGTQSWKIKYCKIWDGENLIRNFIPCTNPSNVAGLYDTVNGVFYTNAGTGSFIAGAEVETVYYTDYLDYENQKVVRNVDDNDKGIDTPVEESVVLPEISTPAGTNTLTVGTEVQPSNVYIKYEGVR